MLQKLLIILFFILTLQCGGQQPYWQSGTQLFSEWTKNISDSNRQHYYNRLANFYLTRTFRLPDSVDSVMLYARKAVYLGDSVNVANKEITNKSLMLLSWAYIARGDFSTGTKINNQVIDNYKRSGDKIREADARIYAGKSLLTFQGPKDIIENEFRKAITIYTETGDNKKVMDGQLELADLHFREGDYRLADSELKQTLVLAARNNFYRTIEIYNILSASNRYAGNFNEALTYTLAALERAEQTADSFTVSNCYGEAALVYGELNQPQKSVYWYQRCIDIRKNQKHPALYYTVYLMTTQMLKINQATKAVKIVNELSRTHRPIGIREKTILFQSLAYCYKAIHDYPRAEKYFLAMIKQYDLKRDSSEELSIAKYDIGKFYVETGQYTKAEQYLPKVEYGEMAGRALSRTIDLHFLWFKIDSVNGRFQSAIRHFQKFKEMNDSLFSLTKTKQIEELTVQYESGKKDQNIKLLENEKKIQQGELIRVNQARNWIVGVAALFLIIIGLLVNMSRVGRINNRKLKSHQKEIEQQNLALEHLVTEKEWLVKEIHHRVKNNFHTVLGLLGTQSQYLKTEEAIKAVNESQNRIHAMSLIHQKLYQSDNMSAINMSYYIHELIDYLGDSLSIKKSILFKIDVDPIALDLSHCIPIGLIINEAVTNSIKYAFSGNKEGIIYISLKESHGNRYCLSIEDNGQGLPPNFKLVDQRSMGLKLIRGLTDDIDGNVSIEGNKGTTIKIHFCTDPDGKQSMEPSSSNKKLSA